MFRSTFALIILLLCCIMPVMAQQKSKTLFNEDIAGPPPPKSEIPEKYKDLVITLERSGCFGPCPAYKVTIYGSGKVVYRGDKNVRVAEERTISISPDKVAKLIEEFDKVKFFTLKDSYEGGPTDGTSATTSIKLNGKTKTIKDYHPAPDSPPTLVELENIIDRTVNSSQWIDRE
jgi:hypothetical protein